MNKAYFYSWIFAYCMGTLYFDVVSIAIFLGPIILFLGVFGYPILFLRILFYYHKVAYESFDDYSNSFWFGLISACLWIYGAFFLDINPFFYISTITINNGKLHILASLLPIIISIISYIAGIIRINKGNYVAI